METWRFKLLYDGECPFCRVEARWLGRLGLGLEDIASPEFDPTRYGTTLEAMMGTIHGVYPDGRVIAGMEVFRQSYRAVGLGWLLAPTGWPVLKPGFDFLYTLFARHRVRLGRLFGRKCEAGRCALPEAPSRASREK